MKPELVLIPNPRLDDLMALFEQLTGRKATPEDRAEAEKLLARAHAHEGARVSAHPWSPQRGERITRPGPSLACSRTRC
jgi:hypothetical protein